MYPTDQALRRNVWIFAAIFVCCAHVALAAFAIARMNEPEDDDLGAPGIEIATGQGDLHRRQCLQALALWS